MKVQSATVIKWIDHNRWFATALLLASLASTWLLGCGVSTRALTGPNRQVKRAEFYAQARDQELLLASQRLDIERQMAQLDQRIEHFNVAVEQGDADLKRKEAVRAKVVQILGAHASAAAEGAFSPGALVSALVSLIGLGSAAGLGADNLRKNRVITEMKKS